MEVKAKYQAAVITTMRDGVLTYSENGKTAYLSWDDNDDSMYVEFAGMDGVYLSMDSEDPFDIAEELQEQFG